MSANPELYCPVRGPLKAKLKAKDGLTFTEEKQRIDCINFLLSHGYPIDRIEPETTILRFGNNGRNSLRADIVVYDRPRHEVENLGLDQRRTHVRIIAEIKRTGGKAESAKFEQLIPALELVSNISALGIYWDDAEQTVFYKRVQNDAILCEEVSISSFPKFGSGLKAANLTFSDLKPAQDLAKVFSRLDDTLHQAGHGKDERYEILFKLLLLKIFDEQRSRSSVEGLIIQDFSLRNSSDQDVQSVLKTGLENALEMYGPMLPVKHIPDFECEVSTLRSLSKLVCSVNILGSSPQVIQDFFMYFGERLFKVDLGQYFTPYEVIDLVVRMVNPAFGERVLDPACGTADFLVGAMRVARERHGADISSQLHGVDTARTAVNLAVFNMILNGDGSSKISVGDSLLTAEVEEGQFSIALCNPPFGSRIRERRSKVLVKFDLGSTSSDSGPVPISDQETGILFVETCLKKVKPGGRVGIILPNGYLGNKSPTFVGFREWLLRHARVAAVVGFPRFTFKKSGADVSASVVILEKRKQPLSVLTDAKDHPIHFNLVDKVGWNLQSKTAGRVYKRDPDDGALKLSEANEPILDADFDRVLDELYASTVVDVFPWMRKGIPQASSGASHVVQLQRVIERADLSLDPKRWSAKHEMVTASVKSVDHIVLGDVLEPVVRSGKSAAAWKEAKELYRYVEIEQIYEKFGAYVSTPYRGWELPDRAKLRAIPGQIFIANIWSSAGKWLLAGPDAADGKLLVTTGCSQFSIIDGREDLLPHLLFGLSSEAFRVQMRALSTGSDGLSSAPVEDILQIVVPRIVNKDVLKIFVDRISEIRTQSLVLPEIVDKELAKTPSHVARRTAHVVQV